MAEDTGICILSEKLEEGGKLAYLLDLNAVRWTLIVLSDLLIEVQVFLALDRC
jgi:hypothetical protein